ncbi:hypothetical protein PoB_000872900 [Plakobranchus ocellatus]|uniref:Uncharacterized protein n=1 Tax=Plakobranchus ocellatus TaxID=259542 RepID=A0AAV3YJK2_9GAST|nr:hypothetical protein PoB_000872900 [Plakobranchus ocellatus]
MFFKADDYIFSLFIEHNQVEENLTSACPRGKLIKDKHLSNSSPQFSFRTIQITLVSNLRRNSPESQIKSKHDLITAANALTTLSSSRSAPIMAVMVRAIRHSLKQKQWMLTAAEGTRHTVTSVEHCDCASIFLSAQDCILRDGNRSPLS